MQTGNENRSAVAGGWELGQGGKGGVEGFLPYIDGSDRFIGVYICNSYQMVHFRHAHLVCH